MAITYNTDVLPEGCNISKPICPFAVEDIRAAQNADLAISRVLTMKRTYAYLKQKHKLAENEAVIQLISEWPSLQIDGDGIFRRDTVTRM